MHRVSKDGQSSTPVTYEEAAKMPFRAGRGLVSPVPNKTVFGQSYIQIGPYASERLRKFLRLDAPGAYDADY